MTLSSRKGGIYDHDAVLDIKRDGVVIASIERFAKSGYIHRSYTFSADGRTLVTGGGNGHLQAFDVATLEAAAATSPDRILYRADYKKLGRSFVGHEGVVWGVATSPDSRFLVSGSEDQTVRLWNLSTGELIVTLFHNNDGQWVLWTPQGYYTGSPGADRVIGWQLNKGPDQTPDYFEAAQLRQQFHRPDIVEKAIRLASAAEAVQASDRTEFKLDDLIRRPPPRLTILVAGSSPKL